MVKFIDYWMFATHLWIDAPATPTVISLREIMHIDELCDKELGTHVAVYLKDKSTIPIEGNIIDVLAAFQKHLQTMY